MDCHLVVIIDDAWRYAFGGENHDKAVESWRCGE